MAVFWKVLRSFCGSGKKFIMRIASEESRNEDRERDHRIDIAESSYA